MACAVLGSGLCGALRPIKAVIWALLLAPPRALCLAACLGALALRGDLDVSRRQPPRRPKCATKRGELNAGAAVVKVSGAQWDLPSAVPLASRRARDARGMADRCRRISCRWHVACRRIAPLGCTDGQSAAARHCDGGPRPASRPLAHWRRPGPRPRVRRRACGRERIALIGLQSGLARWRRAFSGPHRRPWRRFAIWSDACPTHGVLGGCSLSRSTPGILALVHPLRVRGRPRAGWRANAQEGRVDTALRGSLVARRRLPCAVRTGDDDRANRRAPKGPRARILRWWWAGDCGRAERRCERPPAFRTRRSFGEISGVLRKGSLALVCSRAACRMTADRPSPRHGGRRCSGVARRRRFVSGGPMPGPAAPCVALSCAAFVRLARVRLARA
jgi:hypothetical protein